MFSFLKKTWVYVKSFFKFISKRVLVGWYFLVVILEFIWKIIAGPIALVWTYVNALFWVHTIKRFIMFPILTLSFMYIIEYLYTSYTFTFLDNKSISAYLSEVINSHDYLINASIFFYQIGLIQAITIFFYFILVTFVIKLFINIFIRD